MENQLVVIQMTPDKLSEMLTRAAKMAAIDALNLAGLAKDEYSRSQLSNMFSRRKVDAMISSGKLTPIRHGSEGNAKYSLKQFISIV